MMRFESKEQARCKIFHWNGIQESRHPEEARLLPGRDTVGKADLTLAYNQTLRIPIKKRM